jgi:hypothetical protein
LPPPPVGHPFDRADVIEGLDDLPHRIRSVSSTSASSTALRLRPVRCASWSIDASSAVEMRTLTGFDLAATDYM